MLKIIVFLYEYYLKIDNSKKLAYLRVMVWFFAVFCLLQISVFWFLDIRIPYIDDKILTGSKFEGKFSAFLVSLLYFALFYWLYPPKKLELYKDKFIYPKHYIWYLRVGFVLYIIIWMLARLIVK